MITCQIVGGYGLMTEWMIIGGGIQGCTLATYLIKSGRVKSDQLRIIDPHEVPLHLWKRNTSRIQMQYLRSPSIHHIDIKPFSLQHFSKELNFSEGLFGYYKKPALSLFNDHCEFILKEINISDSWIQGRVAHVEQKDSKWKVRTEEGVTYFCKNLVLAAGFTEQLCWPNWALLLKETYPKSVFHVFDQEEIEICKNIHKIGVIGSGISGAHLAIKLCNLGFEVVLISRHGLRVAEFDSDPGWMGQKFMSAYNKVKSYKDRRKIIYHARHKGSITNTLANQLRSFINQERLKIVQGEICDVKVMNETFSVWMNNKELNHVEKLILTTGFSSQIDHIKWLHSLIQNEKLTCAECGFPIVSHNLEWTKGLYVMGALAELEVGPTARNISGARRAAEKIVATL